jgi:hypothetical protein
MCRRGTQAALADDQVVDRHRDVIGDLAVGVRDTVREHGSVPRRLEVDVTQLRLGEVAR